MNIKGGGNQVGGGAGIESAGPTEEVVEVGKAGGLRCRWQCLHRGCPGRDGSGGFTAMPTGDEAVGRAGQLCKGGLNDCLLPATASGIEHC